MKADLRAKMIEKRAALSAKDAGEKNQAIYRRFFQHKDFQEAKRILVTLSFNDEIDTNPLIDRWLKEDRRVYVPVMVPKTRTLLPVRIYENYRDLPENSYGIQEPSLQGAEILALEALDLVIVPGLAFDARGYRLGYGGGYYDRLIPNLREDAKTLALCYDFQMVDEVPIDAYDQRIQCILSDRQEVRR